MEQSQATLQSILAKHESYLAKSSSVKKATSTSEVVSKRLLEGPMSSLVKRLLNIGLDKKSIEKICE